MGLTGRFELNGDRSENGLQWRLYAPRASPGDRFRWRFAPLLNCFRRTFPTVQQGATLEGRTCVPFIRTRSTCGVATRARPDAAGHGIAGKQKSRLVPADCDPLAGAFVADSSDGGRQRVAARQPAQTPGSGRGRGRGGGKRIGFNPRFGIVRLMFITQSSGTRRAEGESDSRAMLYAKRGVGARRSAR